MSGRNRETLLKSLYQPLFLNTFAWFYFICFSHFPILPYLLYNVDLWLDVATRCANVIYYQIVDCTAWTGFLMFFNTYSWYCVNGNQLSTPTCYYMHECQDSLIQCSTLRVFVSLPIPWIYSSLLWTTKTVQHTSAQSISTFSALILAGGYRLITERYLELVPHVCSYQLMTFDWMWTVTWLFKRGNCLWGLRS